jgi:hypothetical protein
VPEILLVLGALLFAAGMLLALMDIGGPAIPIGTQGVYVQYGDLMALAGAGLIATAGAKSHSPLEMGAGIALAAIDIARVFWIGSPLKMGG